MEILAFDACYMGNMEVVTTLAAEAKIFVVTEGRAPGEGFPYGKILADLQSKPEQTSEDIARYIIQANREKYEDGNLPLRQIALLSDGLAPLAEALAHLIQQLDLENSDTLSSVRCAMENAAALGATGNIDLKDFITELLNQSIPANAREAASAVYGQFSRLDLSSDPSLPASGGGNLSIYGPAPADFDPGVSSTIPKPGIARYLDPFSRGILSKNPWGEIAGPSADASNQGDDGRPGCPWNLSTRSGKGLIRCR